MGKAAKLKEAFGASISDSMRENVAEPDKTPIKLHRETPTRIDGVNRLGGAMSLALHRIKPDPSQPRKVFGAAELQDLADSIREFGVLQPIRVRWDEASGHWIIVNGERRYRACMLLGMDLVPAVEGKSGDAGTTLAEQLIENCVRTDLSPIEQSEALGRLLELTGWSISEAARRLGLSKAHVSKMKAIDELPPETKREAAQQQLGYVATYEKAREQKAARRTSVAPTPRKRTSRLEIDVEGGRVAVALDEPDATPERFKKALREALKGAQS
jgi:ParB/RepB/Spo0J family partition protein